MARKQRKSQSDSYLKWKKKNWYKIVAPDVFKNAELGECLLESPDQLKDRFVQANMMQLTRDIKKQNVTVKFKVTDVKDNVGQTQVYAYTMAPASVKRLVRSRRDRIDDSFVITTKDDMNVRIKPMVITRNNLTNLQRTAMRKITETVICTVAEQNAYAELVQEILQGKLTDKVRKAVEKIAPVRNIEVRSFSIQKSVKRARFGQKHNITQEVQEAQTAA